MSTWTLIYLRVFTVNTVCPASGFCALDFPTMMDCNLALWVRENHLAPQVDFVSFITATAKEIKISLSTCFFPQSILFALSLRRFRTFSSPHGFFTLLCASMNISLPRTPSPRIQARQATSTSSGSYPEHVMKPNPSSTSSQDPIQPCVSILSPICQVIYFPSGYSSIFSPETLYLCPSCYWWYLGT